MLSTFPGVEEQLAADLTQNPGFKGATCIMDDAHGSDE